MLFFVNIATIIFNIGALNAFLQHTRIEESKEYKKVHFNLSILFGLFGIIVFPIIIAQTEYPFFGLRYWRLSFGIRNMSWSELYSEALQDKLFKELRYKQTKNSKYSKGSKETGSYIDIWEA
jgi:hypothetical protein